MSGFTSAYKRMSPSAPSPALTRNFSYPCSDNKIHPYQNRVLSLAEAMTLQTISRYDFKWGPILLNGKRVEQVPDSLIRLVIGESVPPAFTEQLGSHLIAMSNPLSFVSREVGERMATQLSLL
jgi:DNA (cytosine-5)-methyltransferase 1